MASSLSRAYTQSLVFGEDSEELLEIKQDLLDEIFDLKESRDGLFGEVGLPEKIKSLEEDILDLKNRKNCLEREIEQLEIKKSEEVRIRIGGSLKKLIEREKRYRSSEETLKSDIKSLLDERKVSERDYEAYEKKHDGIKVILERELSELKALISDGRIEIDTISRNIEIQRKIIEEERQNFNREVSKFKTDKDDLEAKLVLFKTERRGLDELGCRLKAEIAAEKENNRKLELQLSDKIAISEKSHNEYKEKSDALESEKLELRSWQKRLEKKESIILQREEDLNTNWTVFTREKAGRNG